MSYFYYINKKIKIMIRQLYTVAFRGIKAFPVIVQIQVIGGCLPSFSIVGLPDKAVVESRERIRAALSTLGLSLPPKRIIMSLSPANIQKEGNHYDLPLAVALLMALDILPEELEKSIVVGELGLDATIKPVGGVLCAALLAAEHQRLFICPGDCGGEAAWSGASAHILAPYHLLDLINHFKGDRVLSPPQGEIEQYNIKTPLCENFAEIKGQETPKRVITIAAAGKHNVLLYGPPGTGKSMLAGRLISLLPPLSPQEALDVSMIHGLHGYKGHLLRYRPFRSPHHSVSMAALVGGGSKALPGEISLAHGGVLFLDELPEFSRTALESLRPVLESGEAVVARANYHITYPAQFQLIAAMNPCPCGFLGVTQRQCSKAPECGHRYQQRLSGPFLDRIDLFCHVSSLEPKDLMPHHEKTSSPSFLREQIATAQMMQEKRYADFQITRNAEAPPHLLDKEIVDNEDTCQLLQKAITQFSLSVRGYYRVIRVARTIADLHKEPNILRHHVAEALSYRNFPFL